VVFILNKEKTHNSKEGKKNTTYYHLCKFEPTFLNSTRVKVQAVNYKIVLL
jgi:hypothetical protein